MNDHQSLPTDTGAAGDLARLFLRLVGPARQAPDDSVNADDALALGSSFAKARRVQLEAALDAFPGVAVNTISEWERAFGIETDENLTAADRNTVLAAHARTLLGGNDVSIESAVAVLTGYCDVRAWAASEQYAVHLSPTTATRRHVFRFAVYVPLTYVTTPRLASRVRVIVDKMRPSFQSYSIVYGAAGVAPHLRVEDVAGYGVEVSAVEY